MKTMHKIKRRVRRYISKRTVYCIAILGFIMLIAMQFRVMPYDNLDYARHMEMIVGVRRTYDSLWDFLFDDTIKVSLSYRTSSYTFLYVFKILLYFCAKVFDNNYVLSWVCAFITYCMTMYIALDWKKGQKYSGLELLLNFILCFALLPFIHVVSGLRTALAASIVAVGTYEYIYKKKSLVFYLAMVILAATIHSYVLLTVPFVFLTKFDWGKKGFICVFAASASLQLIAQYLYNNTSGFLNVIAVKYLFYASDQQYTSWRFVFYSVIAICLLMIFNYLIIAPTKAQGTKKIRVQNSLPKQDLYRFFSYYVCFIIGNFQSYEMITRQGYILGILAPVISTFLCEKAVKKGGMPQFIQIGIRVVVVVIALYASARYIMINYRYFI